MAFEEGEDQSEGASLWDGGELYRITAEEESLQSKTEFNDIPYSYFFIPTLHFGIVCSF